MEFQMSFRSHIWSAILTVTICTPISAIAGNPELMRQLKQTKSCASCDLSGGNFKWANVFGAELGGAKNLVDANLEGANLEGANFFGANLEGANLRGANLKGANMGWSSLYGANLLGAQIGGADLAGVTFCKTIMPDGTANNNNCF